MIFYGHQYIDDDDIESVEKVLKSAWLTQGPDITDFEKAVARYCGVKYAVAVSNATSALHIACLADGLSQGDTLWTSPNTFVASANCARYCGALVDFVDINDKTYNMDVNKLAEKLGFAQKKPKIVIPVHFAGQSCDMEKIYELSRKYGFTVIEDASHAMGAEYKDEKVGCCRYSDMAVFSFHPVKIITSGEGGIVVTNNESLYEKLCLYRSHGITKDENHLLKKDEGPWYYEQQELGFNYRMTDLQAALGVSQLKKIDKFVLRRRQLATQYNELLKDLPLKLPTQESFASSSWHIYIVRMKCNEIGISKKEIFSRMKDKGIVLNLHYIPVHLQPYYQNLGFREGDYPISEQYYKEAFTLPLFYDLTNEQQKYISDCLHEILK